METLKLLNKKKVKEILNKIKEIYGINELKLDYLFYTNSDGKIFLLSKKFGDFDNKNLNINSIGLYFANLSKGMRLSIEGSQLIGNLASKNVIDINEKQLKSWLRGEDLEINEDCNGFVLIKNGNDFYGSGKIANNKILNFVPKDRRIIAV